MIHWLRFTWKTSAVPADRPAVEPLVLRRAVKDDEAAVVRVVQSAISMDSSLSDVNKGLGERFSGLVEKSFAGEEPACVVLLHGSRVIGASLLDPDPEAESHLLTGPCVLHEYRNRGLGLALLRASLEFLASAGVSEARGIARSNSVAARYVYPKCGGKASEYQPAPAAAKAA